MAVVAVARNPLPRKLRVGLFADSALQPRWVVEAFAKVAASDFAEIALIEAAAAPPRRVPWAFRVAGDALMELERYVPHQQLRKSDLDVAFALGEIDDAALDGIARLGVWRLHADGVREVVEGAPLTGCNLKVRLAAGTEPRLACQSWSRTERLSIARNRGRVLARASGLAWRALRDAERFGRGWLEQCKAIPQRQGQTTISTASALATVLRNRGLSLVSALRHVEESYVAFRRGNGPISPALDGFTRLAGKGRAPFPSGRHVFFEDAGRIAVIEAGSTGSPAILFEGTYPFLVEDEGALYLLSQGRLYRCADFPLRWKFERPLVEGERLVDATLHRGPERWWLFAAGDFEDELNLYHAPKLAGPWTPHARNPVKSDARCARPAGRLYWRNGALYRPAQICVPRAGAGVALNRVLRLTPHDYAERQVETIPGIRVVNHGAELTVVDAFARRSRFA